MTEHRPQEPRVRGAVIAESPAACQELAALFAAQPGFSVVGAAPPGPEALTLVRARKPDLIVL